MSTENQAVEVGYLKRDAFRTALETTALKGLLPTGEVGIVRTWTDESGGRRHLFFVDTETIRGEKQRMLYLAVDAMTEDQRKNVQPAQLRAVGIKIKDGQTIPRGLGLPEREDKAQIGHFFRQERDRAKDINFAYQFSATEGMAGQLALRLAPLTTFLEKLKRTGEHVVAAEKIDQWARAGLLIGGFVEIIGTPIVLTPAWNPNTTPISSLLLTELPIVGAGIIAVTRSTKGAELRLGETVKSVYSVEPR